MIENLTTLHDGPAIIASRTAQALQRRGLVTLVSVGTQLKATLTDEGRKVAQQHAQESNEVAETATHKVGDRLHFTPGPERAPFGSIIGECDVAVIEVVDHGTKHLVGYPNAPRFTYVVRADNGKTQGTDDRELTEVAVPVTPLNLAGLVCYYCGRPAVGFNAEVTSVCDRAKCQNRTGEQHATTWQSAAAQFTADPVTSGRHGGSAARPTQDGPVRFRATMGKRKASKSHRRGW